MLIAKVKVVVTAVLVVAALGAGGVAYHSEAVWAEQVAQSSPAKPRSELDSLRRENELLKLNLEVVLEKVRAHEQELRALRGKTAAPQLRLDQNVRQGLELDLGIKDLEMALKQRPEADGVRRAEVALRTLRDAKDDQSRQRALEALDRALRTLRGHMPEGGSNHKKS